MQSTTNDPVSLYGFRLAPDGLDDMIGAQDETPPAETTAGEASVDYARLGKAIRRNREWFR